ncbi:hypothetical protein [Sphaerisporangium rhizosphaerae]|uniref:Uncharacterized protein n=1 Tax=Sphaerisporangium rhizosphaerae TaxID=2269375 RepID=A0ABW2P665_9ACTN
MSSESSAGAALPKGWQAFAAKPDETTAKAVAKVLQEEMNPSQAGASMKLIAKTLAERSARERSKLSRLIASQLRGDIARGFVKATAATRLAHSTVETPKEEVPQDKDVLHYLDLQLPKKVNELPGKTPGGRNRLVLEGLDLAAAGKVTVDLIALEERIADESDASTMGHLRKALELVTTIGGKPATYSEERRTELASTVRDTTQEHIVEQIGFRAARTQRAGEGGLSTQNELAATYWRTNFLDTLQKFLVKLKTTTMPGPDDILVNSPRVLKKLAMMVDPKVLAGLTITPLVGTTGISVLSGTAQFASLDIDWKSILQELGATPSAYQLYELMDRGNEKPTTDFTVDTRADFVALITDSPFCRLQEIASRKSEPLAPVCAMVEHLVLGLADELGPQIFDTLTANALRSLGRLLDIVVAHQHNPSTAMRAVDLMMDEIGILVAAAGNYTWTDYRETMLQVMLERAPSIAPLAGKRIELDSHLMTSGMEALGTALWIALSSRHHDEVSRSTEKIDYYETGELLARLRKGETTTPHPQVLVATLNPSTPFDPPSPDELVATVRKSLLTHTKGAAPYALILDTTIQLTPSSTGGRSQLDVVLGGLKEDIADGRLEVFLCKSFQKYASFGTGKVAAGDLTMLSMKGNLASAFARAEALLQDLDLDLTGNDEAQLVIHMLRHGHRDELALVHHAAGNAKFVDEFCWPIDPKNRKLGSSYVEGIPLLLRGAPTGRVDKLFETLAMIDRRDSFSFLRTSYVGGIPGPYARINTGHESRESMVEYFYAFGHLATSTLPGAKAPGTTPVGLDPLKLDSVKEHLTALSLIKDTEGSLITRYRNNIVASYCAFGIQNVRPKPHMVPLLIDFFAGSTGGVTIETQRYLARELFPWVQKDPVPADPKILTALYHAALILPSWSFKPFAAQLKLDTIGDSEQARRLRALVGKTLTG